jgi:molybdenum cofactor cytidylyltransferase
MSEIWGIILAAGESKRMGTPKMLMPYKGKTIIENVIATVTSSDADRTIVVLGSGSGDIQKIVELMPIEYCINENYKEGMLSSVKCGFDNLPERFEAALIFLGDQPMVEVSVINGLIEAYHSSGKGIVMPVYGNKRGHPLMIGSKYRDEIEKLDEGQGLRALSQKFPDDVLEIEVNTSTILKDIDTLDDYKNELKQIK